MANPVEQALSVAGLAAHLGRGIGRVTTDAIVGNRAGLPRTVGDLDAPTLSKVMGRTVRSVRVLGQRRGHIVAGTTGADRRRRARVGLRQDRRQTAATRLMGELGRLGHTEVRFYSQLAPELAGVPEAYGTAFDTWTGRYLLILEDLPESCVFPDTLHPLSVDQASLIVELLATVHGTFWDRAAPERARSVGVALHAVGRRHVAVDRLADEDLDEAARRANHHPRRIRVASSRTTTVRSPR